MFVIATFFLLATPPKGAGYQMWWRGRGRGGEACHSSWLCCYFIVSQDEEKETVKSLEFSENLTEEEEGYDWLHSQIVGFVIK